jgi:glutamate dehydrogenase (NAD(P)+)
MRSIDEPAIIKTDMEIEGERFALVVTTRHDGAQATTAIHRRDYPQHIGGARFVPVGGLSELGHLARAMTKKCAAARIPADGQKTIIVTGKSDLPSEERRAAILVQHVRVIRELDAGVIVGPDMNNPESVQDRAARAEGLLRHFTGLSAEHDGLSIDENGYTAYGLVCALQAAIAAPSLAVARVSIQGFGAVGSHTARLLAALGAKIVAVNNKDILIADANGLDVETLVSYRTRYGDDGLRQYRADHRIWSSAPDDIFRIPADIFVPAGRTDVLATAAELDRVRREENPDVHDVAEFLATTGVQTIVEAANHPISEDAERWLHAKGVRILPDFIVNCGGLIGCWAEWNARLAPTRPDLAVLANHARDQIARTATDNVHEIFASSEVPRDAAEQIARRNRAMLLAQHGNEPRVRTA